MDFFDPSQRGGSAANPQSGGAVTRPSRNAINAIFGRQPLFYNAALGDVIVPIVESSLQFPIFLTTVPQAPTVVGGLQRLSFHPNSGKHWMATNLTVEAVGDTSSPAGNVRLFRNDQRINSTYLLWEANLGDTVTQFTNTVFPIGGIESRFGIDANGNTFFFSIHGVHNFYVNDQQEVVVEIQGANATYNGVLTYLELPSNQPFGPSFEF